MMNREGYISMDAAKGKLGVARGTLHYYLRVLSIQTHKFPLDRRAYLSMQDFETIQKLRQEAGKDVLEDAFQPLLRGKSPTKEPITA